MKNFGWIRSLRALGLSLTLAVSTTICWAHEQPSQLAHTQQLITESFTLLAEIVLPSDIDVSFPLPANPVTSLSFSPTAVVGGGNSTGTITLASPAPSTGETVTLTNGNSAATIPASVVVPSGQTTATFAVSTVAVTVNTAGTVSASGGGGVQSAKLTVTAPVLSLVSLSPTSLVSGASSVGTVTLGSAAPSAGLTVQLFSDSASALVPVSMIVLGGSTTGTFTITTLGVASNTVATITAKLASFSKSAKLTITPAQLVSVDVSPNVVTGGFATSGSVTLNGIAPATGLNVAIASNSGVATVPANVSVSAGNSNASFTIGTSSVLVNSVATITAKSANITASTQLEVVTPALSGVSLSPFKLVGGTNSTGTVTLNGPAPTGGVTVNLMSVSSFVSFPTTVTILAGDTNASFAISTVAVAIDSIATLTANVGTFTKSAKLTVSAPILAAFSVNPNIVFSGQNSAGSLRISSPAPVGGLVVTIESGLSAAIVPASVLIPEGATTAVFPIGTTQVNRETYVGITATLGKVKLSSTLHIHAT